MRPHEKFDTKKICRKTNYRDIRTRKLVVSFKLLNFQTDVSVIILSPVAVACVHSLICVSTLLLLDQL